jgi:hypothetical protein
MHFMTEYFTIAGFAFIAGILIGWAATKIKFKPEWMYWLKKMPSQPASL